MYRVMNVLKVNYRDPEAPQKFTSSLKETGFAVLSDHPIPQDLIAGVFSDWKDFFAGETKHAYKFDPKNQAGYFPFRTENAKDSPIKDLKEFFHLFGWNELPEGVPARTRDLYRRMESLASELLGWIEANTPKEIQSKFSMPLSDMIRDSSDTLLRPIHYPPLTGGEEQGAIRAAAHEDINLITLLPAASAPGLEVLDNEGIWHQVACDPGCLAINSGDMLKLASGGYFGSTTHRVVNPQGPEAKLPRYSMPLFLHPRPEVQLSSKHTAESYLRERLIEIGLKK
jgi:isopenicillin N synthase-like dioxygenase